MFAASYTRPDNQHLYDLIEELTQALERQQICNGFLTEKVRSAVHLLSCTNPEVVNREVDFSNLTAVSFGALILLNDALETNGEMYRQQYQALLEVAQAAERWNAEVILEEPSVAPMSHVEAARLIWQRNTMAATSLRAAVDKWTSLRARKITLSGGLRHE